MSYYQHLMKGDPAGEELNRKFGQDFEILDRGAVKSYLQRVRERPDFD